MSANPVDVAVLEAMKQERPKLWRKLIKAARRAQGRVPVQTERGDERRAMAVLSASIHGRRTSGKRQRKDAKAIRRAMRAEVDALTHTQDSAA